ncbi:MAG: DegT/DnrJ/EryC1/StrS family aminotransferase [Algicola sp.]|nr:DegT/DnrJ/EryC1/StrS family aminotransferase [Algicola sp.]
MMKRINVTKTFLPPIEEFTIYLKRIWENSLLTNRGELVLELESKLKHYLNVEHLTLTTNGTLPIQIALKELAIPGNEVITTPFSYVATTSSIVWEGLTPVFVDIHPEYLTIDETKIEAAITPNTSAILATHVFGNPCHVEAIERIAQKHNLIVIYDAAHAFGVLYQGKSIFSYGSVSTCSFHATKLFHTAEGGCWITPNKDINDRLFYRHNFGHDGPGKFYDVGINAKMSELQAAMGLSVFPYINDIINKRKQVDSLYKSGLNLSNLKTIKIRKGTEWNYSYFPVIFDNEEILLKVYHELMNHNINTRRYFYPSLNNLEYVSSNEMPFSDTIAKRVLCLPTAFDLEEKEVTYIINLVNSIVYGNA